MISRQKSLEIESELGFIPAFLIAASDTPLVLENLWQQMQLCYVNNPLPVLFKEKLFAYLSRYCSVAYCIICHSCEARRLGMQSKAILELLETPTPTAKNIEEEVNALPSLSEEIWLEADWEGEKAIFSCAIFMFLHPNIVGGGAIAATVASQLQRMLGSENYNHLMAFLGYIKTCHLWVEAHPQLAYQLDKPAYDRIGMLFVEEPRLADFFRNYSDRVREESYSREEQLLAEFTQNLQALEELQQKNQALETLIEARSMATISLDNNGNVKAWSQAAERMFGWSPQEVLDRPLAIVPEDQQQEFWTMFATTLQGGIVASADLTSIPNKNSQSEVSPSSSTYEIRLWTAPVHDSEGNICGIMALISDITDHKQSSERLRLLESVVVNANDAILITEAEPISYPGPRILFVNEAFSRMTGYSAEEVLGKTPRLLQGPKTDRAKLDKLRRALERWEPVEVDLMNYRKNGAEFWVELSITPVANEKGWYTHWISIQREIDERKWTEEEYQRLLADEQTARRAAEEASRAKDEFLAIVSHELRSPLSSILGWSRLLSTRNFDEAITVRALEIIERNARVQAQRLDDLADISRTIRGTLRLNVNQVNLISVVEAALKVVAEQASYKAIALDVLLPQTEEQKYREARAQFNSQPSSPPLWVLGDAVRLQQIVWNLIDNAIKFTPSGGRVEVRLEQRDHHATLRVSDTGIGINPEMLPSIFERFRQADSSMTKLQGKLGLGLAIVRNLVELHGGTVGVESPGENQGATFTVQMPLLPLSVANNQWGMEDGKETGFELETSDQLSPNACLLPNSYLDSLRVLVVDDEADVREFIRIALKQCGAIAVVVSSAQEALEALAQDNFDVLVSDIGMPGENGYSLVRKLRAMEATQNKNSPIQAIALTAYTRFEEQERAIAAGFQVHICKPVDPGILLTTIASLVSK